jgi:uncharacterized protein
MNKPTALAARYQSWTSRHRFAVLLVAAVLVGVAAYFTTRLELRTAFSELLPSDDPGVVALNKVQDRMGDLTLLLVGIRSPDRQANERYAAMMTEKLLALPNNMCKLATYHLRDMRDFFANNKWLYVDEGDLETLRDRLKSEIARRKNPLLVSLDDDEEPVDKLRTRVQKKDSLSERFPDGLFTDQDGRYLWIAALPSGGLFAEHAGEDLWKAARALIAANPPQKYHPEMTAYVGGPIATAIVNREAVEKDILWVTITCLSIVGLSIGLYFRNLRSLFLVGAPAIAGTMMAFAFADLTFGYLNSSTAFLASIIVGNGINYAIVFLSRYDDHRLEGDAVPQAIARTIEGIWRSTGSAMLAASAAYASLMVTSFRGFYQFGVMGAVGVLACWVATFTILPSVLALTDRRPSSAIKSSPFRLAFLGGVVGRGSSALLLLSLVITGVGIYGATHFLQDPFEYDFRNLSISTKSSEDTRQFSGNLDKLFGRWPSPTILLSDNPEDTEPMRQALRRQDAEVNPNPKNRVIDQIVTVDDILPGKPDAQRRKLEILADIRRRLDDPALDTLKPSQREELMKLRPPETLRVLTANDLPPLIRRPFTEVDGTVGRVLLVYPPEQGFSVWDGRILLKIAKVQQEVHLKDKVVQTSGFAVVFGAMIRSVLHDGPIATTASLLVIMLIAFVTVRPRTGAAVALLSLLLGVIWMVGAAGLAGVRVTFLNFIALPITFGVGIEYAINIVARYQENKAAGTNRVDAMRRAVGSMGGAVALCSWTTIVGYGSLLAASNRALKGFGAMAILGEIACLSAAILALPSLVIYLNRRRRSS